MISKKAWFRRFALSYREGELGLLYGLLDTDLVKICMAAYEDGATPEEAVNAISEKETEVRVYMAKHAASAGGQEQAYSINDITRETYDIIGKDRVGRDLYSPSLEELAEIFEIDICDLKES